MSSKKLFNMMVIATVIAFQTFLYAFDKEEGMWKGVMVEFEASTVLVGIDDPGSAEILVSILDTLSASVGDSISQLNIWILDIPDSLAVLETCEFVSANFDVRWAEPNLVGYPGSDDQYFNLQWNLKNTGQEGGTTGADIDIENAWAICRGSNQDTIAILDTGIPAEPVSQNLLHEDLDDPNRFELGGIWSGASNFRDCIGHGTLIGGIAGAETDNELFVAGTCPECVILIEKITNDTHFETTPTWFAWGICHAADAGSDVANFSWGFRIPLPMIEEAIAYAGSHQMLVTICSGNNGENDVWYPCDLSNTEGFENVICVGGTDRWDNHVRYWVEDPFGGHWQGPNFGPEIDIAGPYGCEDEIDVLSTFPPYLEGNPVEGLFYGEGTSYAAPHVAGVVGLIRSLNPNLTAIEVTEIIEESAEDVNADEYPGEDDYLGHGRLNAFGALLLTPTDGPKTLQADVNMGAGRTYGIVGNLVVPDGITMTINEGVHITMHPGSQIKVEEGGTIEILGTALDPVVFEAADENDPWNGIKIYSGGGTIDNHINNCDISGASIAVRLIDANADFSFCIIHENICGIVATNHSTVDVTYTVVSDNDAYGCVIAINSTGYFTGSHIMNNPRNGIWCVSYGRANLDFTSVNWNGDGSNPWYGGLKSTCGTLDLYCSSSSYNNGPGINSGGSFVDLCQELVGIQGLSGVNTLRDNVPLGLGYPTGQIFIDMAWLLGLIEGHNNIVDNEDLNRPLIVVWQETPGQYNWIHNYWGQGDEALILSRLPAGAVIVPYDQVTNICNPDAPPKPNPEDPDKLLFYQAWQEECLGSYEIAIADYKLLINTWPESPFAKLAVDRIVFCEGQLGLSWQERRDYFLALADGTPDLELEITSRNAAAWCSVQMGDYQTAETEFVALISMSPTMSDSIKIAINRLMAELAQSGLDTILAVPNPGFGRELPELNAAIASDRELRIIMTADALLNSFNIRGAQSAGKQGSVPTDYQLHQNYPNPFNAATTIRYGLPDAGKVTVKVFDILGREVVTLVNRDKSAGHHHVTWDGKSSQGIDVSSGLYFYRLEANDFVDVKKMVLLR